MDIKKLLTLLLLIFPCSIFGQNLLEGVIVDEQNEAIPYVRLGIINSNVAEISGFDGKFRILIPSSLSNSKLTLQVPGYHTSSFSVDSLMRVSSVKLSLNPRIQDLGVVVVGKRKRRIRKRLLGNKAIPRGRGEGVSYGNKWTVAMLIASKRNTQILNVKVHVAATNSGVVSLRPRVFEYDSRNNIPGKELLNHNVIVQRELEEGWIELDISDFHLIVEGKVCVGFEILSPREEKNGSARISTGFARDAPVIKMWEQTTFLAQWRKASNQYIIKAEVDY